MRHKLSSLIVTCLLVKLSARSSRCREEKLIIQRQRFTYQHEIPPLNKAAELDIQAGTTEIWSLLSFLLWVCIFVPFVSPKVNTNTRKWLNSRNETVNPSHFTYCLLKRPFATKDAGTEVPVGHRAHQSFRGWWTPVQAENGGLFSAALELLPLSLWVPQLSNFTTAIGPQMPIWIPALGPPTTISVQRRQDASELWPSQHKSKRVACITVMGALWTRRVRGRAQAVGTRTLTSSVPRAS